jgi:signal transduction histidine kinase
VTLARTYLVAGLAAVGVYFLLPWDSFAQTLVYDAIGLSAAAAAVAGARIHKPSARLPWYLFAAGLAAFAIGDVLFNLYDFVWNREPPVPSVADVFYLAGYPALAAGLILLVRRLRREERRGGRIDAAMLIVAFALCQWVFIMKDAIDNGSFAHRLVALLYPAMDVVLLSALVFFALTPVWRTMSYRYLAGSLVLLIFADELYGLSPDKYAATSWLDAAWLLSYVLWGVAALHPSMRELSEPVRGRGPRVSRLRFGMLVAALATAPGVLLVQAALGLTVEPIAIAIGAGALCGLVLVRLMGTIHALDRLRADERVARAEAETAQQLLTEQNRRLREADRLKDEFVALVSHDLRTPLTSITGYVELALEDDLSDQTREYLGVVARNSDRLLALVNDLLFVASLQAGDVALDLSETDLGEIVRESVESMEPRAAAKKIALTCELETVPKLDADTRRILQVVDNLVSNAIKFTPEAGSVHVSLATAGDGVVLEVADSGIGIAPADQRRLFERFFRAENAVSRHVPGTGLGLYIAREIAAAHDGSLTVRSELGHGSTFRFELPLAVVAVPEPADGLDRDGVRRRRVELAP